MGSKRSTSDARWRPFYFAWGCFRDFAFRPLGSQMAGALARGPAFRRRKADRGAERDPVGVLACYVVAVDQVDRKDLVGPVAHAGLKPRPDGTGNIRGADLAERFDGPLQGFGELPVEAGAVGQVVPVGHTIPQPAAVEIDPHVLGEPVRQRKDSERGQV